MQMGEKAVISDERH